jgi:hypothetical protein
MSLSLGISAARPQKHQNRLRSFEFVCMYITLQLMFVFSTLLINVLLLKDIDTTQISPPVSRIDG